MFVLSNLSELSLLIPFFLFLETDNEFALYVEQIGCQVKADCFMVLQGETRH